MLGEVHHLSIPGQLLKTTALLHLTDLEATDPAPSDESNGYITEKTLPEYCKAQTDLLQQVRAFAECYVIVVEP